MDHMILAAEFEGVGTCWVGAYNPVLLREALSLGDDETVYSITPLGYTKPGFEKKGNKRRKLLEEIVEFV
jgi:nitroreductase